MFNHTSCVEFNDKVVFLLSIKYRSFLELNKKNQLCAFPYVLLMFYVFYVLHISITNFFYIIFLHHLLILIDYCFIAF